MDLLRSHLSGKRFGLRAPGRWSSPAGETQHHVKMRKWRWMEAAGLRVGMSSCRIQRGETLRWGDRSPETVIKSSWRGGRKIGGWEKDEQDPSYGSAAALRPVRVVLTNATERYRTPRGLRHITCTGQFTVRRKCQNKSLRLFVCSCCRACVSANKTTSCWIIVHADTAQLTPTSSAPVNITLSSPDPFTDTFSVGIKANLDI